MHFAVDAFGVEAWCLCRQETDIEGAPSLNFWIRRWNLLQSILWTSSKHHLVTSLSGGLGVQFFNFKFQCCF